MAPIGGARLGPSEMRSRATVIQGDLINVAMRPGTIAYASVDGVTRHWPSIAGHEIAEVPSADLVIMRIELITALTKAEDELVRRELLHRVTRTTACEGTC